MVYLPQLLTHGARVFLNRFSGTIWRPTDNQLTLYYL
jgi:hypothetical protein